MSTDLIATAANTDRAPDATAADGTPIYLDTSDGTALTDAALTAWRRAAVTGDLPTPARSRWQQLRAGVVNMWEFDAAEYWSADGRAQFVGRNEQGKSTMMAMTTLTMLTGDLSPRYVDTFGDSHRTFRYYLEATDDPKDRRSTDSQLNRGWTWVEYGRMTDDGPQYFTTLLFVQARRSSPEVTKKWVTHTGPERVRDGLTLLRQQAVLTATDLPSLPGLTVHTSGRAYAQTVASTLFGFTDPERLRTVVELLKTLRTPKLGNRLNPDWVIERIREALPPLDSGEVAELAEGWDQLGQLAADRDAAREAQEAVTAFIKSTWNPWADATLRLAADDLVAAVTAVDDVTRDARAAQARAEKAHTDCDEADKAAERTETERQALQERRETLLRSQQYRAAADAGRQVLELSGKLEDAESAQQRAREAQQATRTQLAAAERDHAATAAAVTQAERDGADAAGRTAQDATAAGLPAESAQWSAEHDTSRLEAALTTRRGHVREARNLARKLAGAQSAAERETRLLTDAQAREQRRRTAEGKADEAFTDASQDLSDQLEAWTASVSAAAEANAGSWTAPTVAVREQWLETVFAECSQTRPVQRLAQLVQQQWTQPAVDPLVAAAVTAANEAKAATGQATALDAEAARVESEPTPVPPVPHNWDRRVRPASSADGAPLWELLDPVPDLPTADLAGLEAALAGSGLLDAWVTPDGAWRVDRDGDEHVVTLTASAPSGPTLGSVLTLAEPAQAGGSLAALAATANRVLAGVGWRPGATSPAASTPGQIWVAADGSWATPTTAGRAAAPQTGARLLGACARAQERARRVAALRAEADQHRTRAAELAGTEARHRAAAEQVRTLAGQVPSDSGVIGAALDLTTARRELADAEAEVAQRSRAAKRAAADVDEASAALLDYASRNTLDPARLDKVEEALNRADRSVTALATKAAELRHARSVHELRTERLQQVRNAAGRDDAEVDRTNKAAARFAVALQAARDALNADAQELLDEGERLGQRVATLDREYKRLTEKIVRLSGERGEANGALSAVEEKRAEAEAERAVRLAAWWVPVDAGLAAARGVQVPEGAARTLTAALGQARSLRAERRAPRGWPDGAAASVAREREQIVVRLRDRLSGPEFFKLNSTLNRTGGRSAVVEHDDATGLPRVQVLVDASSVRFDPARAVQALAAKSAQLGELHDEKMHKVMEELLSSTFVDHLRDKVKQTESLLREVNAVLLKHPTGSTRTVLRLRRKQVGEHQGGYQVLNRLLEDSVDSPAVQQQVQAFLTAQIRATQDEGHAEGRDWKELLVDKLDYRNWFAVVTEWRVLSSAKDGGSQMWHELTRERHGQDSGGGKVMTMLQPLLATLATLYQNSETAPRPLWLDEAFDGVDAQNTTSLLGMLVDFDFDFILAGPKSLVASRHVPCAAVWMVNRAQAPTPGVDLGLWLYAAGTKEKVTLGAQTWNDPAAQAGADPSGSAQDGGQEVLWA